MNRLSSVGIYVSDLDRAVRFYGEAFGFAQRASFGSYVLLDGGPESSTLILSSLPDGHGADDVGRSIMKIVIMTDDAAATLERIGAAGGTVTEAPRAREQLPYVIGFGADPDGHRLEIIQPAG